ncbi:DNA recombination protein RmuC [Patescibacteria group bacterium]|nr:DNA recombination protein RmuC [Patescibacteria group bacterium]MBU1890002.1 DNA recombination protein RmuC [Patescibacteria group bacterium]
MENIWLIILIVLVILSFSAVIMVIVWQFRRLYSFQEREKQGNKDPFLMIKQDLENVRRDVQTQQAGSLKVVRDVTEKLTRLDETNKQVVGFTDQLQQLQDILKNPKQRGVLGEYYLENVLKNVLPPSNYQLQYGFKNGDIVDAVIFVKDKVIPIDSKFSLENYNRISVERDPTERGRLEKLFKQDLKNRIDETAKYIRTDEKTMDFAFMFIPAEAIYYDLLINQIGTVKLNTRDLIEYAFKDKHVIIVSPTSFFAYLQTVLQGLRALQIEESAKEIRKNVEKLAKHLFSYEAHFNKLGTQLGTTVNTFNSASKEYKKIDKDVYKISGQGGEVEAKTIDKPKIEE